MNDHPSPETTLDQEPASAGPPGIDSKMRKFVQRNRTAFAVAATISILLVAGIFGTSWYAIQATKNLKLSQIAEERQREAKESEQEALKKEQEALIKERAARKGEREAMEMASQFASTQLMRNAHYKATLEHGNLTGSIRKGRLEIPVGLFRMGHKIQFTYFSSKTKDWQPFEVRHGAVDTRQLDVLKMVDGKSVRLPDGELGQAIEGTDITYEDLAMPFLYWPNGIWEGSKEIKGQDCWVVRAINPGTAGNYGQVRVWIHKRSGSLMQVVGYGREGRALKRIMVTEVMNLDGGLIDFFMGRLMDSFTFREVRFDSFDPVAQKTVGITYLEFNKPKPKPRSKEEAEP